MATTGTILDKPIRVADLTLPPEIAEMVARDSHKYTRRERIVIEEDVKLDYHYSGHYVIATDGPQGLLIHAIDLENPDDSYAVRQRLRAQGYRHVLSLFPRFWDDEHVAILTLNSVD
jgi:hypothetical protein